MNDELFAENVAENIRTALLDKDLTVTSLADKIGMPRTTLARHLNHPAESPFNTRELARISNVIKRSVYSLLKNSVPVKENQ